MSECRVQKKKLSLDMKCSEQKKRGNKRGKHDDDDYSNGDGGAIE